MKRFAALLIAVLLIFSFSACGNQKKTALVIAGTEINSEIFTYFLDKVISRPIDYNLPENPIKSDLKQAAIDECKKYLAANTAFRDNGLSLTSSEKVEIAQTVNDYWIRFENHYKNIGVSKQTLTKILTAQVYENAVFAAEYDKGPDDIPAEAVLQNYFYRNYISFRNVCAYFTSADGTTPMTQLEKNQLITTINELAANAGTDVEKFAESALAAGYSLSGSVLLKNGDEGYPDGFFEKVAAQGDGTVQVLTYDECIFIVWKESLKEKGESLYISYRDVCLRDLYSAQSDDAIIEYISTLSVKETGEVDKILKKLT